MTDDSATFANQLLIAMPALTDPNFVRTVTYVCEHSPQGTLGIVINRPLDITLQVVFEHMNIPLTDLAAADMPVYLGGPVEPERGFVLHSPVGNWNSSVQITPELAVTTSRDILESIAEGKGPTQALIALGYAGWGPGQLEKEMAENAWLNGPADTNLLFATPADDRWEAAAALLGVNLHLLSTAAGHA